MLIIFFRPLGRGAYSKRALIGNRALNRAFTVFQKNVVGLWDVAYLEHIFTITPFLQVLCQHESEALQRFFVITSLSRCVACIYARTHVRTI